MPRPGIIGSGQAPRSNLGVVTERHEPLPRLLAVTVVALVGVMIATIWLGAAQRGLEYDELWTLNEYAHAPTIGRIFSDTTPNNHPLNSWFIRLTTSLWGNSEMSVRLPALIAGTCLLICLPFVVHHLTQRWEVALLATAWVAGNAPLVHYAQAARGYSFQVLLILAFAALILTAYRKRDQEGSYLVLALLSGIVAMIALPTTVLFLPPVVLVDVMARARRWRRQVGLRRARILADEWRPFLAYTTLALACAVWISRGSEGFVDSQTKYGDNISSVAQWLHFCVDTIRTLRLQPIAVLAVIGSCLCLTNRTMWTLNTTTLWLFVAAWLLSGLPPRAYVPLVPFMCMAAAMGLGRILDLAGGKMRRQLRCGITVAAAILPVIGLPTAVRAWTALDWKHLVVGVRETAGPKTCIVYPVHDGYVLGYYYAPDILLESFHRLPSDAGSALVLTEAGGRMTGVDIASGRTMSIFCPERLRVSVKRVKDTVVELTWYRFDRLPREYSPERIEPQSVYFMQLGPEDRALALRHLEQLYVASGRDQWQLINPHLELVVNQSGTILQAFLLATTNADTFVREWTNTTSWSTAPVRFYQLASPKIVE